MHALSVPAVTKTGGGYNMQGGQSESEASGGFLFYLGLSSEKSLHEIKIPCIIVASSHTVYLYRIIIH